MESLKQKIRENGIGHLRFAEWRPQTLSADVTLEIPPIVHHISEEDFQSLDFHCWIEMTALTIKNAGTIANHIDQLIEIALRIGRSSYRNFPPLKNSFRLTLHFLSWHSEFGIQEKSLLLSTNELLRLAGRTLNRDLEKIIKDNYDILYQNPIWNPSQWSIIDVLDFLQETIMDINKKYLDGQNIHIMIISGWETENSNIKDTKNSYEVINNMMSHGKGYLYSFVPLIKFMKFLEDILGIKSISIMDITSDQYETQWKQSLLSQIEPTLEIEIISNDTWVQSFALATNLSLFDKSKQTKNGLILHNIMSVRYPVILNFLFKLPIKSLQNSSADFSPVLWDKIVLILKGKNIILEQTISSQPVSALPLADIKYQSERELNERIRLADSLRQNIENIVNKINQNTNRMNNWISNPNSIQLNTVKQFLSTELNDLSLAIQILDHLAEEELLL